MKNAVVKALALVGSVVLFVACSGSSGDEEAGEQAAAYSGQSTCTVYDYRTYDVIGTLSSGQQMTVYIPGDPTSSATSSLYYHCVSAQLKCDCYRGTSCVLKMRRSWGWDLAYTSRFYEDTATNCR